MAAVVDTTNLKYVKLHIGSFIHLHGYAITCHILSWVHACWLELNGGSKETGLRQDGECTVNTCSCIA
jgi:hypothetical protein